MPSVEAFDSPMLEHAIPFPFKGNALLKCCDIGRHRIDHMAMPILPTFVKESVKWFLNLDHDNPNA